VWTSEQQSAISHRAGNLLVSAGAGAGKTAVLVERIIARLLDPTEPLDIDEFLVVTFTNAAAAEMRSRIGLEVAKKLRANPDDLHLRRQSMLINKATIGTLHSFCLDMLRRYFYRLDLDPMFRVADEIEADILRIDALDKVLEQFHAQGTESFRLLAEGFGGSSGDIELGKRVLELYEYSRSQALPDHWLKTLPLNFNWQDTSDIHKWSPWYKELRQAIERKLEQAVDATEKAKKLALSPGGPEKYIPLLDEELSALKALIKHSQCCTWENLRKHVQDFKFGRLPSAKGCNEEVKEQVQKLRDSAKKIVQKDLADTLLVQNATEVVASMQVAAALAGALEEVVRAFAEEYRRAKRMKNVLDFSDLEHLTLLLFSGEQNGVLEELRNQFKEVLVDEYQDINEVQERILSLVSRGDNLVMVGDVKQSIYRFRLADPTLFISKYVRYSAQSGEGSVVDLAHNFRSRPHVIEAINHIFLKVMSLETGEVDYDNAAKLVAAATYPADSGEKVIELLLFDKDEVKGEDEEEDQQTLDIEAYRIAKYISGLVESGEHQVCDRGTGQMRPLAYRDVVVLLRAVRSSGSSLAQAFRHLSVPAHVDVGTGYFATTEISVMLSLLQVVDNPDQDIPLAAVLRSPCVGLSGADLAAIRALAPDASFYEAVRRALASPDAMEGSMAAKLQAFMKNLQAWRQMSVRNSLADLIWRILSETGYYNFVGAMPGGPQRQANLRALYTRACQFEATSFRGLFRFLRLINRLQEEEKDMGEAPALSENENVVRVMSVHKSKGLEFPLVVVAGLGRKFNLTDFNKPMLVHRELGLGLTAVDLETRVKYPTIALHAVKHRLLNELLSEEMRILYVALTRAKEKLVLAGSVKNLAGKIENWTHTAQKLESGEERFFVPLGRRPLDWLGPACFSHPSLFALTADYARETAAEQVSGYAAELSAIEQGLPVAPQGFSEPVQHRLLWNYPHEAATNKRLKVSVSELKKRAVADETRDETPPLLRGRVKGDADGLLTGAKLGTALHMVIQHVPLNSPVTMESLRDLLKDMATRELLSARELESVDLGLVLRFFEGSLGQRLLRANRHWRELPFGLRVPAKEIHPGLTNEFVYVQGVIDCLFAEEGRLILLDFKSDWVTPESKGEVVDRYRGQLGFYGRAVHAILGQEVAESYLYLMRLGEAVNLS